MISIKKQIEMGGAKKGYFSRNHFIEINESFKQKKENFIKKYNNTDVYQTILETWIDEEEKKLLYGPIYLDIDGDDMCENAFKKTKKDTLLIIRFLIDVCHIPENQINLYFSGSKGFHILIPPKILGLDASEDLNIKYKTFAEYTNTYTLHGGVDTGIYDNRRLFRLNNSINSKTGLYKVPMTIKQFYNMDYNSILEYASKPRKIILSKPEFNERAKREYDLIQSRAALKKAKKSKRDKKIVFEDGSILPCVEHLLENGTDQGSRNNTCVALASSLLQNGQQPKQVSEIMLEWNERNDPPLPETEVLTTVKSAHQLTAQGRGYGCTFFYNQGYCQEGCPLAKE